MKIHKMTATFGRLEGAVLELTDGLNILEAPNEGGKSTWCAFLRAMLYGIPTKERDRTGYVAEKNRYQPWSGSAMEGAVALTWGGQEITLRRFSKGNVPFGGFEAVDTATGAPVAGLTGENAGEVLLGVPRAVFERSAFVGQSAVPVDADPELEKRIAALISSGEEDVSYSATERRLKDWQNRRRHNKSGLIPKLEEELEGLDALLLRLDRVGRALAEGEGEAQVLRRRKGELEAESTAQRARLAQDQRTQYDKATAFVEQCRAEVSALAAESGPLPGREALRTAQGDLAYHATLSANLKLAENDLLRAEEAAQGAEEGAQDPLYQDMSADQAAAKTEADRVVLERPRRSWPAVLALVAAVVSATVLVWLKLEVWLLIPGVACFLVFLLELLAGGRARRKRQDILSQYGASTPEDLTLRATEYREKRDLVAQTAQRVRSIREASEKTGEQREALRGRLLDLVHPFAPEVTDLFGVSAALSRALALEGRLGEARAKLEGAQRLMSDRPAPEGGEADGATPAPEHTPQETAALLAATQSELLRAEGEAARTRGERDTLGDPTALAARRGAAAEELSRRTAEHEALTLALETLGEANTELQTRFAPALNRRAGALFSALTGGKYEDVSLTREFDAAARETGAVLPRRALLLSKGTADQLYLAVRLAVCELALPAGETAPLVLDDALINFDDGRMALALALLKELSEARQILLFTCHTREKRSFSGGSGEGGAPAGA